MAFDMQAKEALAEAARFQIHTRIEAYSGVKPQFDYSTKYLINSQFADFFSELDISDSNSGLIKSTALKRGDFQKLSEYKFSYGGDFNCPLLMEFYPRGVIQLSHLEEDRKREKTILDKIKAEAVRASKRLGKLFTLGRFGDNGFKSEDEYFRLLKHPEIFSILNQAQDRKVEYLGFVRCDISIPNLSQTAGTWVKKWQAHHKLPIVIVPGINEPDLETLIRLEKERIGI